jgi:hypothetical protein
MARKKNPEIIISAEISESLDSKETVNISEAAQVIKKAKAKSERKSSSKNLKEKILTMIPSMNKGSHLTVYTFPDGRTELVWDDAALLKDVKDAILSVEQVKSTTRKKKAKNV